MYSRTPQREDEGTFFLDIVKIALGVFIGSLAAVFTYEGIVAWRIEQAARKAVAEIERQTQKANAEENRRRALQEEARVRAEQQAEQRRAALAMGERLQREQRDRKESAWKKFYQPSQLCQVDSSTVPCANEYMAAKRRFEASYVDR